eukprot:756346-Hanusia_phi.AAC.5
MKVNQPARARPAVSRTKPQVGTTRKGEEDRSRPWRHGMKKNESLDPPVSGGKPRFLPPSMEDKNLVEYLERDIMISNPGVSFDSIAGLPCMHCKSLFGRAKVGERVGRGKAIAQGGHHSTVVHARILSRNSKTLERRSDVWPTWHWENASCQIRGECK